MREYLKNTDTAVNHKKTSISRVNFYHAKWNQKPVD